MWYVPEGKVQYPHNYINIISQICKDFEHDKKAGKTGIPAYIKEYWNSLPDHHTMTFIYKYILQLMRVDNIIIILFLEKVNGRKNRPFTRHILD